MWSADFVFDRTVYGRVLKCLTIVDDATTEAVVGMPARALGGLAVTRVLDHVAVRRGFPTILRTDNALEFCGRAMLTWAHERGGLSGHLKSGHRSTGKTGHHRWATETGVFTAAAASVASRMSPWSASCVAHI